ncbi:MAG: DUF262 domain-containing protein [Clostridia bacterium]|nr:DUF262 domain-containing protein [Clostridia bacterium]
MKIELYEITIKEITKGYSDNSEQGVTGFCGKLNIRPPYQREFIYNEQKRNAVIDTINKGFPLNVMYWVKNDDGSFEVLDGQQRTISFCQYVNSDFSINNKFFHNLTNVEKNRILDYKCMIYICEGTDLEKLEWFKTINIAGEQLTAQELRNAVYTGPWLSDAKLKFSKSNCPAYLLANKYVNGSPLRQELLETAIEWINDGKVEQYMSIHQYDSNANNLWIYFKNVIDWVQLTFTKYRKEMKGINWAELYNLYHEKTYDTVALENRINELFLDDEVTNKKGIYLYVLDGLEKHLSLRSFSESQKLAVYKAQGGKCPRCKSMNKPTKDKIWEIEEMEGDHITPWHEGGKTDISNCQMLCRTCNREKGGH